MTIDRDRVVRAFADYVGAYDPDDPKISLKIDHTYRVASLCDRIARSAGFSAAEVDVAWLCGMLHDVGRFEQVRRYGTFNDGQSVSHARMGVHVLFEEGRIRDYVDEGDGLDDAVRTAVATHSDYRLPAGLDARTRALCDVLRDADKVDILKAFCESDVVSVLNLPLEEVRASELSPAVLDAFYGHRTVVRDERRFPADYVVGYACFVYELVYLESLRAAREQGFVFKLFDMEFDRPETRERFAEMGAHLRAWVDSAAGAEAAAGGGEGVASRG